MKAFSGRHGDPMAAERTAMAVRRSKAVSSRRLGPAGCEARVTENCTTRVFALDCIHLQWIAYDRDRRTLGMDFIASKAGTSEHQPPRS